MMCGIFVLCSMESARQFLTKGEDPAHHVAPFCLKNPARSRHISSGLLGDWRFRKAANAGRCRHSIQHQHCVADCDGPVHGDRHVHGDGDAHGHANAHSHGDADSVVHRNQYSDADRDPHHHSDTHDHTDAATAERGGERGASELPLWSRGGLFV
jgi:hypothetical protein